MSVHLSEEEQVENLKRWWKDNGKWLVGAVVVAIAGYFGVSGWQDHQRQKAEQASANYEQLIQLVNTEPGKTLSAEERSTLVHLANTLKAGDSNSLYAHSAAFFLAKLAVEDSKLDEAASELKWVLSAKPDAATAEIARLRLARVLIAQQNYTDALAQLANEPAAAFASEYHELRGDALKFQGDQAAARTAYEKALVATVPQQQERTMLLQMKVNDLKTPEAVSPTAESAQ